MEVFDLALNYISYKNRTEKEIRDYLKKKSIRQDLIESTVEKLKEYNYINDENYLKQYLEFNKYGNQYGLQRLKYSLKNKGINNENLPNLNDILSNINEEEFCLNHFKKIKKQTDGLPYSKRINKIISYLSNKGFKYDLYSSFLKEIPKLSENNTNLEFEKYFDHYLKLYKRKGFSGRELKNRIIKGLLSRGISYDIISSEINELELDIFD